MSSRVCSCDIGDDDHQSGHRRQWLLRLVARPAARCGRPLGPRARPQRCRRSAGGCRRGRRRHPRPDSRGAARSKDATSSSTTSPRSRLAKDHELLHTVNVDGTTLLLAGSDPGRCQQGGAHLVECGLRRAHLQPGAAVDGATPGRGVRPRQARRRAGLPATRWRTVSTSPSSDRAPSSGMAASASSGSCSNGSPTVPTSSCSARATTGTSSSTPTISPRCACVQLSSPGPAVFNAGTDRFGTMRESLESLCAHAGTGSRGALASRPARGGLDESSGRRAHRSVRAVPLDDVLEVAVVRHRACPRGPRLATAVVERGDAGGQLRLVRAQPRRDRQDRPFAAPHDRQAGGSASAESRRPGCCRAERGVRRRTWPWSAARMPCAEASQVSVRARVSAAAAERGRGAGRRAARRPWSRRGDPAMSAHRSRRRRRCCDAR